MTDQEDLAKDQTTAALQSEAKMILPQHYGFRCYPDPVENVVISHRRGRLESKAGLPGALS